MSTPSIAAVLLGVGVRMVINRPPMINPVQNLKVQELMTTSGEGGRAARRMGVSGSDRCYGDGPFLYNMPMIINRALLMQAQRNVFGEALDSFELGAPKLKKFKTKK